VLDNAIYRLSISLSSSEIFAVKSKPLKPKGLGSVISFSSGFCGGAPAEIELGHFSLKNGIWW